MTAITTKRPTIMRTKAPPEPLEACSVAAFFVVETTSVGSGVLSLKPSASASAGAAAAQRQAHAMSVSRPRIRGRRPWSTTSALSEEGVPDLRGDPRSLVRGNDLSRAREERSSGRRRGGGRAPPSGGWGGCLDAPAGAATHETHGEHDQGDDRDDEQD